MKCEEIAELLPDYLQGSLKAEQDNLVEQHIAECGDCREEVAIQEGDTKESLHERLKALEHRLIVKAVRKLAS